MKKKRVAALVMAAILGVTGFSVPGIGVVQAEEAHTEMSGEAELPKRSESEVSYFF